MILRSANNELARDLAINSINGARTSGRENSSAEVELISFVINDDGCGDPFTHRLMKFVRSRAQSRDEHGRNHEHPRY